MPQPLNRRQVLAGAAAGGLAAPFIRRGHAAAPSFKLYFMVPNNQAARMAWGKMPGSVTTHCHVNIQGTGVETPPAKKDPSRAAEATKQKAGGYGHPRTVPIPWSAPEYDHEMVHPVPFDMGLARHSMAMAMAGYGA